MSITELLFGDFNVLCQRTSLPFCKAFTTVTRTCTMVNITGSAANVSDLGEVIATFLAFLGTLIIAYRTHTKYAAVGRIEMNLMNLFYGLLLLLDIVLNILGSNRGFIGSLYAGVLTGFFWILFLNGFVGYQVVEDGSALSVWGILLSTSLFSFLGGYFTFGVSIGNIAMFGPAKTNSPALFGILLIWPIVSMSLYVLLMTVLVVKQLSQRKPMLYLSLSIALAILSFIFTIRVSDQLCMGTRSNDQKGALPGQTLGYLTGAPFGVFFGFLAYGLLFKFWFAITEGTLFILT